MASGKNIPDLSAFRYRIQIGQTISATNENGFPVEEDTVLCDVWAAAEDDSSNWYHAADADNAERCLCFTIRWRKDITAGMWVMWNGEKQTITKIGEYDFKRRYMKLTTTAVKGVD